MKEKWNTDGDKRYDQGLPVFGFYVPVINNRKIQEMPLEEVIKDQQRQI